MWLSREDVLCATVNGFNCPRHWAMLALFLLHVLGSLRRRSSDKALHAVVLGTYTLSYTLVSYTIGLVQKTHNYRGVEFPVLAVCLLMLLSGTYNLLAYGLGDVDNWKSFHVRQLVQGVLVVYIIAAYGPGGMVVMLLWAILAINVFQSCVRIKSMRMASKSHLLQKSVKPIADYIYLQNKTVGTDITSMDQVWQCTGSLLSSKRGMRLRLIIMGVTSAVTSSPTQQICLCGTCGSGETHDFVFRGLLAGDERYEWAFRVIEVELGFIHDLYYTRYPYLYRKVRYFVLCLPIAMVILCSWLTCELFKKHKEDPKGIPLNTTLFLMVMVTFLETFQLYLHMASGWFKVALIESYASNPSLQRGGCFPKAIMGLALGLKVRNYFVSGKKNLDCAYLITFVPDLLPDPGFDSANILDKSFHEPCLQHLLRDAKTMNMKGVFGCLHEARSNSRGTQTGRLAEMMLYAAPCDEAKARAHLKALARGGEFITHLWALLTHGGVLERGTVGPLDAV
ncbi:hypothetical protein VPH35_113431 [Triticum aestivum]